MKPILGIVAVLAFCSCPTLSSPGNECDRLELVPKVMNALLGNDVLLIGETHQKAQSVQLVTAFLNRALETHRCVSLAVEIASDQQAALDAVRSDTGTIDQVEIWDALDFPPYRAFLAGMLHRSAKRPCFRIHAIDLPAEVNGDRDAWMAGRILRLRTKEGVVIALLGTLHVVGEFDMPVFPMQETLPTVCWPREPRWLCWRRTGQSSACQASLDLVQPLTSGFLTAFNASSTAP